MDATFDRMQAAYDAMEPDDPDEWDDGTEDEWDDEDE